MSEDPAKREAAEHLRRGWVPTAVAEFTGLPLSTVNKIAAALKGAEVRAERRGVGRIVELHNEGRKVAEIAALTGAPYRAVYDALYQRGLQPNVGALALPPPTVRRWSMGNLLLALSLPYAADPWAQLAQRLAFNYGEAEALRRINTKGGT